MADRRIRAEVRATVGHRGVLWLHPNDGAPLSPNVSNPDPFYEKVGGMGHARRPERPRILSCEPLDDTEAARRTADAVNAFCEGASAYLAGHRVNARRALGGKPIANALLLRNAGALPDRPLLPFSAARGRRGAALTEMPVERGIARVLGLEDRYVGPMGPDRDEGYRERARIARELLEEHPFVYVHLKGPDEPGHDGDAVRKKEVIEAIDRSFFGPFLEGLDLGTVRVAVTADHATPASLRGHSDDPVPFLLVGAGVDRDGASPPRKFGASVATHGAVGVRRGNELLGLLFGTDGVSAPRA